ncbi:hypothetical protein ACHAW6_010310 [Cyclotella cf. meneghiniana]
MNINIANFFLNTPLKRPEFIQMQLSNSPEEIIQEYKFCDLINHDNYIYIKIVLGMYGLLHASLIANKLLEKHLNTHGYHQSKLISGLWKSDWHPIWFILVVDDFDVNFVCKEHALHLKSALKS